MLLFLCFLLSISFGHHALYLSSCEILIEESGSWYGSVRIFHDDLEDALQNATGSRPNLTQDQIHLLQQDIELYLNEHLFFKKESGRLPYKVEQIVRLEDLIEIGVVGIQVWDSTHLIVHNDLLIELFESQKNIMTIRRPGQFSTLYFNKQATEKKLDKSLW
jgi:hypothetical protein